MRREVEIINELGMHARPAAEFVRRVESFASEVTIWKGEERFAASSILGVLTANLRCGTKVELEAVGADAEQALNSLSHLLRDFKRDEERVGES